MSEQADSSDNYIRTVLYFYHHKPIGTGNDSSGRDVTKYVNSDFFGSSFSSGNRELQHMEKKLQSMEQALKTRKLQLLHAQLCFLKKAGAGKLDHEETRKWAVLFIVQNYMINKEKDEVDKLDEDCENYKEALLSPLVAIPQAPCTASQ